MQSTSLEKFWTTIPSGKLRIIKRIVWEIRIGREPVRPGVVRDKPYFHMHYETLVHGPY